MKARTLLFAALAAVLAPGVAVAATLLDTLGFFNAMVNGLVPLAISLALVAFFWGLIVYLFGLGSEENKQKGIHIMLYGIAALFVMVSIWGIINVLRTTFNVENNQVPVPAVPQLR
jgi:hypothetical protein